MFSFFSPNFQPQVDGLENCPPTTQELELATTGLSMVAFYSPGSSNVEEALHAAHDMSENHEVTLLPSAKSGDPKENAHNLLAAAEHAKPKLFVVKGGDGTVSNFFNALYTAGDEDTKLHDIPVAVQPFGTGNDFALSISRGEALQDMLANGRLVDFRPGQLTIYPPDDEPIRYIFAGQAGINGSGGSAVEIDKVHDHPDFWRRYKRHGLLIMAAAKGYSSTSPFIKTTETPNGQVGIRKVQDNSYSRTSRYAIQGRTRAKLEDDFARGVEIFGKWSPRTMFYMGCLALGKATGVRVPSRPILAPIRFRATSIGGDAINAHFDGEVAEIKSGSIVEFTMAERFTSILVTHKRP